MTDALIDGWRAKTQTAQAWRSGEDPEPVLEALALVVALELTGALGRTPREEREALRKLGQRALLQVGGREEDEEDLEAMRMCAAIARDGLRALGGRAAEPQPATGDVRVVIPPSDLTRLLRGELDGFAAGALALKVRRSSAARAELSALLRLRANAAEGASDRSLALAAASAAPVLDPSQGRVIGTLASVGAEAVLFDADDGPRRLAIYAEEPDALRLIAPELTTEDVREGYWVGRLAEGTERIEATLEIGERTEAWTLELPDGQGS